MRKGEWIWMHALCWKSKLSWLWLTKKRDFCESEQSVYCSLSFSIRIIFTRPGTSLFSLYSHIFPLYNFGKASKENGGGDERRKAEDAAIIIQNLFFSVDTWVSKISLLALTHWLWFLAGNKIFHMRHNFIQTFWNFHAHTHHLHYLEYTNRKQLCWNLHFEWKTCVFLKASLFSRP